MSLSDEEQGQPEVNPDDENANFDSAGAGEADVDPDDDTEADYEEAPADGDDLIDAENRVKAGNTGAESTGPNQPASAADRDPGH